MLFQILLALTTLTVAVSIPVRNRSSPKARAMQRLRWTKLWSFVISSFLQCAVGKISINELGTFMLNVWVINIIYCTSVTYFNEMKNTIHTNKQSKEMLQPI